MNINTARKTARLNGCVLFKMDDDGMYYLKVHTSHKAWKPSQQVLDFAPGEIQRIKDEGFRVTCVNLINSGLEA